MKRDQHILVLNAQAEALSARIILEELRGGRLPNALELLEQQLDVNILILERFLKEAADSEKPSIREVIKIISDYRTRYPRKTEAQF